MPHTFYLVLHVAGLVLLTLSLGGMIAGQQAADEAARVLEEKGYVDSRPKILLVFHGLGLFLLLLAGFGMLARLSIGFPWPLWIWVKVTLWLLLGAFPTLSKRFDAGLGWYIAAIVIVLAAAMGVLKPF